MLLCFLLYITWMRMNIDMCMTLLHSHLLLAIVLCHFIASMRTSVCSRARFSDTSIRIATNFMK